MVYGKPALVTAVASFARCQVVTEAATSLTFQSDSFPDTTWSADELRMEYSSALDRWKQFEAGRLEITDVLSGDHFLPPLCWAELDAAFPGRLSQTVSVRITSELPPGGGMGSSAAVCTATLFALATASCVEAAPSKLFEMCLQLECFQHGTPSGADPYIAVHGGCLLFKNRGPARPAGAPAVPLHLVHTGRPEATTGEAVSQVRSTHGGSDIWSEFESTTLKLAAAMTQGDLPGSIRTIRHNHRLLAEIGIVPDRVRAFIHGVEATGGAAKISGAGSVRGESGGVVLVCAEQPPRYLCKQFGYTTTPLETEPDGVRILGDS